MNIYTKIYLILLVVTLTIYATRIPAKKSHELLIIVLMVLWLMTTVSAFLIMKFADSKNNLFIFHIATPIEYGILSTLYAGAIVNKQLRKFILYSIPVFVLLSIISGLFVQSFKQNNSYMVSLESILLIWFSLYFLREVLLFQPVQNPSRYPMFYICVAILFYFIGNLVIEGMLNYLIKQDMEMARTTYRIGYIFKYLLFILFIAGAFCSKKQPVVKL